MRGSMEPKIEELKDGRLLMIMRTQLGSVFKSYSEDGGATWSDAQTTGLRSPESCPLLMRVPQTGDLLLIWNDSPYNPKFDHYGLRNPLSTTISKDDGLTWLQSKPLETNFDQRGALVPNRFLTTIEQGEVRTQLDFEPNESAVIVPIPVQVDSGGPVNARVMSYDESRMEIELNGAGTASLGMFVGTSYPGPAGRSVYGWRDESVGRGCRGQGSSSNPRN